MKRVPFVYHKALFSTKSTLALGVPGESSLSRFVGRAQVGEIRFAGEIVLADGEICLDGRWVDLITNEVSKKVKGVPARNL